jgi:hypothetical protein
LRLLLINYSYHLLSGSELNPLSSFSVPLQSPKLNAYITHDVGNRITSRFRNLLVGLSLPCPGQDHRLNITQPSVKPGEHGCVDIQAVPKYETCWRNSVIAITESRCRRQVPQLGCQLRHHRLARHRPRHRVEHRHPHHRSPRHHLRHRPL